MASRNSEDDQGLDALHTCSPGCDAAFQNALGSAAADADGAGLDTGAFRPVRLDVRQFRDLLDALPPPVDSPPLQRSWSSGTRVLLEEAKTLHHSLYRRSSEEERRRYLLLRAYPVASLTRDPGSLGLDADACAALLSGPDGAREVVASRSGLLSCLELVGRLPDVARLLALQMAVLSCRPAPPLAVGLLLADPAAPSDVAGKAAAAWQAMRRHRPDLPEHPLSLPRLTELAAEAAQRLAAEAADPAPAASAEESAASPAPPTAPVPEPSVQSTSPDLDSLAADLDRLSASFKAAAGAARRVHDAVAERRRPDSADLDRLTRLVADLDRIGAAVCAVTGRTALPASLAELAAEFDAARAHAARAGLLSRFATLTGPATLESVLSGIRTAARTADEAAVEWLRLLAELVDRQRQNPYDSALLHLGTELGERIPQEWGSVVMAALSGQLSLGGPAAAPGPAVTAAGVPEEVPAAGPASPEAEAAAAGPSDAGDVPAPEPLDDALAELDAVLAAESAPPPPPDTAAAEPAEDPDRPLPEATPAPVPETVSDAAPETTPDATAPAPDPAPQDTGPAAPEPGPSAAASRPAPEHAPEPAAPPAAAPDDERSTDPAAQAPALLPVAAPAPARRTPALVRHEQQALQQRRFALAGWLNRAAGLPENIAAIRDAAACAEQLRGTTGPMVEAFRVRAEALADDLPDDPADRLLAWAAAIRAVLVAPITEAFQLIVQTSAVTSGRPALQTIGEAFRTAAQSGVYLDLSHTGELLRDADLARQEHEDAVHRAAVLRENARSRTINYQAASALWRQMVSPGGALWDLLDIPASNNAARLGECRRLVSELLVPDAVDNLIDRLYRESRRGVPNKKRHQTIIAGARTALRKYTEDVRDAANEWITAVDHMRALDDSHGHGPAGRGLGDLRQVMVEQYERAAAELDALVDGDNPLLGAAARGARHLLDDVHALLRGRVPQAGGLAPTLVLNRDVLLVPRIRVSPSGEVAAPPTLEELAEVLRDDRDPADVCGQRIERGDLVGAELVADLVRVDDPALADRLVEQVSARVDEEWSRLREACEAFQTDAAMRWRNGALSEEEFARLRGGVELLLSGSERRDFDVMAAELDGLRAEADRLCEARISGRREEVRRAAETSDQVARYADRLRRYLDHGQVTSADETLAQLRANRGFVVRRDEEVDHFSAFYPAFPKALERTQRRVRRGEHPLQAVFDELLRHLNRRSGDEPAPVAEHPELFADLLAAHSSHRERTTAGDALRQWRTVAQGAKSSGNLKSAVEKILLLLGVEGTVPVDPLATQPQHRERLLRMSLTGVKLTGDPLLPAFGSKMVRPGPAGSELLLHLVWKRPEPREMFQWLSEVPRDRTVLVLYFGLLTYEQRQELASLARGNPDPVVAVVDDAVVSYLAALAKPEWSTTVRLIAPFTATRPFQAERMIPEEMFYGREEDLNAVMAPSGAHFVYGGRQLGKSVLLAEAGRRLRAQSDRPVVVQLDIYEIGRSELQIAAFWARLGGALPEHGIVPESAPVPATRQEVCDAVRRWSRAHPDRRLLMFFDEADEFLNLDAREHQFANVVALRELMNATDNRVKAVFAGLHKIARFRSYPNQPFANLGEPLGIGPLAFQDAFDLLTRPLRTLGFHLPEDLAVNIIAQANNAPAIVQYFGDLLLKRLRRSTVELPYEVTVEDVQAVRDDTDLDKAFRDRFEWTLDLDRRYKVIAYAVALRTMDARDSTVDEKDLLAECRFWWPTAFDGCSPDEFGALLEECVDLGVLAEEDGEFRLRTPHILNLLGGRGRVERELQEADSTYQLPDDSFDPAYYRAYYADGPELSPLTAAQAARLGQPDGRPRLVVGSDALQLSRVPRVLADAVAKVQGRCHHVRPGGVEFAEAVRLAGGRDVVLVELAEPVEAALAQVAAAEAALRADAGGGLNVVLLASPVHAPLISGALGRPVSEPQAETLSRVDVVELRRFGRSGVGQWRLLDDFEPIAKEAFHEPLFRVTGGWPSLVNEVVREVVGGERRTPQEALAQVEAHLLADPDAFVASTGVTAHPAVLAAWAQIAEHSEMAEPEDGLVLLLELAEEERPGLFDAAGHGAIDLLGLVWVLRGLGALVPVDGGRLAPEPVLLAAYRSSRFAAVFEEGR